MIIISTFMLDTHFKLVLKVLIFPVNIVLMCTLSFNARKLQTFILRDYVCMDVINWISEA